MKQSSELATISSSNEQTNKIEQSVAKTLSIINSLHESDISSKENPKRPKYR